MNPNSHPLWDYDKKRNAFSSIDSNGKMYTYIDLPPFQRFASAIAERRRSYSPRLVAHCDRIHVGGMIPRLSDHSGMNEEGLSLLRSFYQTLLQTAAESSVTVAFAIEHACQEYLLRTLPKERADALSSRVLVMREYLCDANRTVTYRLRSKGKLMSLVAIDEDRLKPETVDLRHLVEDGKIVWTPESAGNWRILEFACEEDVGTPTADLLSYNASYGMLSEVWNLFSEVLEPYTGRVLTAMEYHDVSFDAPNRRSWTNDFNEVFESLYGFDPAPYYPALFRNVGIDTAHLRALFFACRSRMMEDGFLRAAADFAASKGLTLLGSVTEPKLTASPWITGDNLKNGFYAPGALMDKAYLYGTNSVKIAAAAAYNFDRDRVSCELYRSYYRASKTIFYNDAMNALSRGANRMMVHIPLLEKTEHRRMMRSLLASHWELDFSRYIGRVQTLLSGGRHVADIALLYPIYDLCGKTNFYHSEAKGFEYPQVPSSADYMNVINSISTYAGHDLTVLHPETLNGRCRVENGRIALENERNREEFSILILPATELISLENLRKIAEFYDGGGKVIATGMLPSLAYEYLPTPETGALRRPSSKNENDKEIDRLVDHIFGPDASNAQILRPFFYQSNERGGESYFLPFTATSADGSATTKSKLLSEAIHSFDLPLDVYIPDMPRLECIGALNSVYPEFEALGLARSIPGGGMLNHIHKRHGSCDVYFFSNTTNDAFSGNLLLRGKLSPESWDPYTGAAHPLSYATVTYRGAEYTRIHVSLPSSGSILIVSDPARPHPDLCEKEAEVLTEIEGLT